MFGEDHPAILRYNGNILTCLSITLNDKDTTEEDKIKIKETIK